MSNSRPLAVGDIFHGFAQGSFGRDHYDCTKIEAAGPDWIVCRDADGDLSFASGRESLLRLITVRDEEPVCKEEGDCTLNTASVAPLTIPGGY